MKKRKTAQKPARRRAKSRKIAPFPRLSSLAQAEEQIRRLSCAIESLRDAVYITDDDHNIIYANPAISFVQGYKPEEVIGLKAWKIFEGVPGNPPDLAGLIRREARNGFWVGDIFNRRKDGSTFPVQLIENTIYGARGEVLGYIGVSRDISDKKELEQALRNERDRLENLIQTIPDLTYYKDLQGRYILVNKSFLKFARHKKAEVLGRKDSGLLPPGLARQCLASDKLALSGSGPIQVEESFLSPSGERRYFETIKTAVRDLSGRKIGILGISRDVTSQKKGELALLESEEKYRSLTENSLTGIYVISPQGKILYTNATFHRLSGYSAKEIRGKDIFQIVHPADRPRVKNFFLRRVKGEPTIEQYQCQGVRKDGSVRWIEIRAALIRYRGQPVVLGNFIDITEQKRAEEALSESEARYRTTLEAMGEPIHVIDRDLRIVLFNRTFKQWNEELGLETEAVGRRLGEVFPFLTDRVIGEYQRVFAAGRPLITEESIKLAGREYITETRKIPILEKGRVSRVITVVNDITARRQAEARLREASKLEAVGTLALGIAHEFNNILMGISGYAQLALAAPADREMAEKALSIILRQTQRGKTLIQRISIFGRREKPRTEPVDLTRILDEVVALQERELILANVRIRRNYQQPSPALADHSQMEQVFFNLLRNARQAIEPKGSGVITLSVCDRNRDVEVRISDTGIGLEAHELGSIFRPFFTTKARERGDKVPSLGLGLWVSSQIVTEHRGKIAAESRPGKGATFIVTLPRAVDFSAARRTTKRPARAEPLQGKKVLVVDDELELLDIYQRYLSGKGMAVFQASDGQEALRLCRKERFEAIFLDYVIPGISGAELVRRVKKVAPRSRIFVITGKPLPKAEKTALQSLIRGCLSKPLELERLEEALSSCR